MAALNEDGMKLYYFVGRLNPPHDGHIAALRHMIQSANATGQKALIILGNGPNGGITTMEDPITFASKERVLRIVLAGLNFDVIEGVDQAVEKIVDWAKRQITPHTRKVVFVQVSGNKDDNSTKLGWLNVALMKQTGVLNVDIVARSEPFDAVIQTGVVMSATTVRKDAYTFFLSGTRDLFAAKYGRFYGDSTYEIYDAIIQGAKGASPEDIQAYIDKKELPPIQLNYIDALNDVKKAEQKAIKTHEIAIKTPTEQNQQKASDARQAVIDAKQKVLDIERAILVSEPGQSAIRLKPKGAVKLSAEPYEIGNKGASGKGTSGKGTSGKGASGKGNKGASGKGTKGSGKETKGRGRGGANKTRKKSRKVYFV